MVSNESRRILTSAFLAVLFVATLAYVLLIQENEQFLYENVTPQKAKKIIDSRSPIILDVRTPDEYKNGHIPNAILVPIDEIKNSTFLEVSKNEEIIIYCENGRRSSLGAKYLAGKGYHNSYNLLGGNIGLEKRGFPDY